jgi:hypothetical protein
MDRGKFLQTLHCPEPQHGALTPWERLMGVLGATIQPKVGFVALGVASLLHRRTMGSKPVRDQNLGRPVATH